MRLTIGGPRVLEKRTGGVGTLGRMAAIEGILAGACGIRE